MMYLRADNRCNFSIEKGREEIDLVYLAYSDQTIKRIVLQIWWNVEKSCANEYTWHKTGSRAGQRDEEFSSVRLHQHGLLSSRRKSKYSRCTYFVSLFIHKFSLVLVKYRSFPAHNIYIYKVFKKIYILNIL